MEVLVIGAGSLGSLVGGLLAPDHDVTLVGRDPHVSTIRTAGLAIGGEIQTRVEPSATIPQRVSASADLAIVTVKAGDTADAAETLTECDVEAVWSLQNGLGNEATLAEALDVPVLAGTATYGADQSAPGSVTCTGIGEVAIGPRPETETPEADLALAEEYGEALSGADAATTGGTDADADAESPPGLDVLVDPAMPERLWRKLAVNVGINPTTALARADNGALAEDEIAATARTAARETARVAQASGVDLDEADAAAELDAVVEATADNRSSMLQDVERGRRTEIDQLAGAVVDRAEEHEVSVPVARTLTALVRAWERANYLR
ncbi:2-dehydropantoate 2-reductase [Salinarchaeum sp. Harcht-Bsk1]|uniref:ketopantoate reductase family protein n=1 Tax=Salinarchaeum sp. Harcht-Bsk1 TaxID=1333523 RepID=UPI0003424272|nr:2-dehydropantoate 2-reductase [Salinarchaeum sp. Harcht-Bsk1]